MQIKKEDWLQFFPFKSPRSEQIIVINNILNQFLNGNKKFYICDLGTGLGKSAIAITVSRYMAFKKNFDYSDYETGAWFLTTQKILQEQYISDFGEDVEEQKSKSKNPLKMIKSASNYCCSFFEKETDLTIKFSCADIQKLLSAHEHFKKIYGSCNSKCTYKSKKSEFLTSVHGLTNYSYFMTETKYAGSIIPRELLICDEAHTIEESLSKFIEISISEKFSKDKLLLKMPNFHSKDVEIAFEWIKTKYKKQLQKKLKEIKNLVKDDITKVNNLTDYVNQQEILDKHIGKVNRFIDIFEKNPSNWILNTVAAIGKSMRKLVFKPIDVSYFSDEVLFNYGHKVLLLSATIIDKDVFCNSLGIDQEDAEYIQIPSPFDPKNKPIHILPIGSMSKNSIENTLPKLTSIVKDLLEEHLLEKGIIHTSNFKISNYLRDNISSERLIFHDSSNRDLMLQKHLTSKLPTVLVSPSMMEGVDLKDELSRFQIICKMPYPFLGDDMVKKRMALNSDWYSYMTVKSLVQSVGRSIRSPDDHAVTYILDADWNMLFKKAKKMIPKDFLLSICD